MATVPTVPDQNSLTPEQIAQQIADQTVQQPLERDFSVVLETGQVYKGKTKDELIEQLKKAQEEASKERKRLNDELKRVQSQPNQPQPTPEPQPQPQGFNTARYYELWAQDPNAAEDYRFQSTYGVTQGEAIKAAREAAEFTAQVKPQTVIAQWQQESDFPTSDPAELDKAGKAFETVWNELIPGAQITPQNLTMIHAVCLQRGLYRSEKQLQETPANNGAMPNPTLEFGGGPSQGVNPNTMTPEQLKAMIEKMGQ